MTTVNTARGAVADLIAKLRERFPAHKIPWDRFDALATAFRLRDQDTLQDLRVSPNGMIAAAATHLLEAVRDLEAKEAELAKKPAQDDLLGNFSRWETEDKSGSITG